MSLQFVNSLYKRPSFVTNPETGRKERVSRDALIYTVKDSETGLTHIKVLPEPIISFYMSKTKQEYHRISIPKEEATEIETEYSQRNKNLAKAVGLESPFYESFKTRSNWEFMKRIKNHPYLYMADVDIEDYYKMKFMLENGKHFNPVDKAYMDIEVDIHDHEGFPHPETAPCKINLISYLDVKSKSFHTFILYQEENRDQINDVRNNEEAFIKDHIDKEITDLFTINLHYYEKEVELIKAFFITVHVTKPDFIGIWNMPFDIKTIINRLYRLGLRKSDIEDIMCHPDIPKEFKTVNYIEERNKGSFSTGDDEVETKSSFDGKHPSRYFDWVEISGYSQFYDQMALFSNLRKRNILPSYKLDDIGEEYANTKKVDLRELGLSIKDVNIVDFKSFVKYNIQDVFVQYKIEESQEDIDRYLIFSDNTRLQKGVSATNVIKNMIMYYLWENGEIIGNSIEYDISEKLEGAIVAKPELIEVLGEKVLGSPSYVFKNSIDLDAASEYPSIMIMFNITKSAIYGRVTEVQAPDGDYISNGSDIMMNLQTIDQSVFEIAKTYLNLPTPGELISSIEKGALKAYENTL